jgi:hypothetical protein
MDEEFVPFPKIPRWSTQHIVITEKIDGTNAQVYINDECTDFRCGSRSRWITESDDNYGFARWCNENRDAILSLGKGQHFGEWYGSGIQRNYGLSEKRFVLFNTLRWGTPEQQERLAKTPIGLVPVLYQGPFNEIVIETVLKTLGEDGSKAVPGFMNPEGIIIYIPGSRSLFKYTYDNKHKGEVACAC